MENTLLICPVCRQRLSLDERTYRCPSGHCYDMSKKGYVNLAMSQRSSKKRSGDDRLMLDSRTSFLNKGYYTPLCEAIAAETAARTGSKPVIIDAGCGEGYYTAAVHKAVPDSSVYGIDISKDALICTHKRDHAVTLAAASAAHIPIEDGCADVILSIFAPVFPEEFSRLLSESGIIIRAVPLERHLIGLKQAVYPKAYLNPPDDFSLDGFKIISKREIRFTLTLDSSEDIKALFMMTPYYYKTSREDQQRLLNLTSLTTEIEFGVIVYEMS